MASVVPVLRVLGATFLVAAPLAAQVLFQADFSSSELADWVVTYENDFKERTVAISEDERLRVRADTMGTRDESVKFLGARLLRSHRVGDGLCVKVTLDWNDQANGSYLTAALILAGEETDTNPLELADWLAVEYKGVPPGRNARMQIRAMSQARAMILMDEGWPARQVSGREIDEVRIELQVTPARVTMWENGELLHDQPYELSLQQAFVHLQLASHSNYRAREVYFDDVEVSRGACASGQSR